MLYPHNLETYNKIIATLNSGINNLALIQGMGTGKSFVFMELAHKYFWNKKILYIIPQKTIEHNLRKYEDFKYIEHHVDFITNNQFKNDEAILNAFDNYDVFVADEGHHIGSLVFGSNIQMLLSLVKEDKAKTFITMTATPRRDCDRKNIAKYFDNTIYGLSTLEAIEIGLMPQIQYLMCSPDVSKIDLKKYNIQIDYENSMSLLEDIVYTNQNINRWLCYYGTIKALKENRKIIKMLFPDFKIIEITSDSEHSQNTIDEIEDDEKVVICSVNKLLEGIHLPNMLGVLLFRKVHSLTVFTQILGRITSVGQKEKPLFVDCTGTGKRLLHKLQGYSRNKDGYLQERITLFREILGVELKNAKYFDITKLLVEYQTNNEYIPAEKYIEAIKKYLLENKISINDIRYEAITEDGLKIGKFISEARRQMRDEDIFNR